MCEAAPRVTVVIPAWNIDETLRDAVRSVEKQTVACRALVVDNASDRPLDVPSGTQLLRLRARCSIGAARNAGLDAVSTPYVMFLDADDVLAAGAAATLVEAIDIATDAVAIGGMVEAWDPDDGTLRRWHWPPGWSARLSAHPRLFAALNVAKSLCGASATIVRTDIAQKARFADSDYCEDWAFVANLAFRGRVQMLGTTVLHYRNAASGMSQTGQRSLGDLARAHGGVVLHVVRDRDLRLWARLVAIAALPYHALFVARVITRRRRRSSADAMVPTESNATESPALAR